MVVRGDFQVIFLPFQHQYGLNAITLSPFIDYLTIIRSGLFFSELAIYIRFKIATISFQILHLSTHIGVNNV